MIELTKVEMRPANSFLERGFFDFCMELRLHRVKNIIEIGSFIGESLLLFKKLLGQDVNILTIDPFSGGVDKNDNIYKIKKFNEVEEEFNANVINLKKYAKFKFNSNEIVQFLKPKFFDLVYIDGLHTYEQVKADILNYLPLVKNGGIISGHDFELDLELIDIELFRNQQNIDLRKNVSRAVREILGEPDKVFQDSTWIKKII